MFVGLDFGTTNSAIAVCDHDQPSRVAQFSLFNKPVDLFRSILYFSFSQRDKRGQPKVSAGPYAIEDYLEEDGLGRLILSPKSSLASKSFQTTQILHKQYSLPELVAIILRHLRDEAEEQFGPLGRRVVAGRPVRFAGADDDEERTQLALERLHNAFAIVGFDEVVCEFEPVAAAYSYETSLDHDELVLVADFGGGTTDFCVIKVGPSHIGQSSQEKILGIDGVPIAGDTFDGRIVREFVSPHLGINSTFKSQFGEVLPMPIWPYSKLEQWHLLGMLSDKKTLGMLHDIQKASHKPEQVEALIDCIEGNLGFYLYRAVEQTKVALSNKQQQNFRFTPLRTPIEGDIQRDDFETWITKELDQIASCCDRLMDDLNLGSDAIDRVFLTGGTSFVPSVRQIFIDRFGEEKMGSGNELTSVASGLAQIARHTFEG
ncbi:MAG TPA: Hsp70 family protein [Myxococcales bacterium]|nr:hsp70 family protein [Deltaproteobacteria bacterium]HAA57828.1 Hsp70 family protein [Myxococcales bacterium]|tara:strand:+ start:2233 stop:3525 length:1293 start_codon:yes stop_codon:yes gene_type:complete